HTQRVCRKATQPGREGGVLPFNRSRTLTIAVPTGTKQRARLVPSTTECTVSNGTLSCDILSGFSDTSLSMANPTELLLVDDEEGIRITLSALLQSYGFNVTTAASVPIALSFITQYPYDVLL